MTETETLGNYDAESLCFSYLPFRLAKLRHQEYSGSANLAVKEVFVLYVQRVKSLYDKI